MLLRVDGREAQWRKDLITEIATKLGHTVEVATLQTGDLQVGDIGFEFKEPADFVASLLDQRLFQQANEMRQAYKRYIFVINGTVDDILRTGTSIHPNAVMGAVSSLRYHYGAEVNFTGYNDRKRFYWFMGHEIAKATDGKVVLDYNPVRRQPNSHDYAVAVLASFPGIGWVKAQKLLGEYKTLASVFNTILSVPENMTNLKGFGLKTVGKMAEVLSAEHNLFKDVDIQGDGTNVDRPIDNTVSPQILK